MIAQYNVIPNPDDIAEGYDVSKKTDLHSRILKLFLDNPDRAFRVKQVHDAFPKESYNNVYSHCSRLVEQSAVFKPNTFEYQLNPAYKSAEQKRIEVQEHINKGQTRLTIVPRNGGLIPRQESHISDNQPSEQQPSPKEPISSAQESLRRHLQSVMQRMSSNNSFSQADVQLLEELELMALG